VPEFWAITTQQSPLRATNKTSPWIQTSVFIGFGMSDKPELTLALMMEAVQTSETSVNSCHSTRRYNPEDSHLQVVKLSVCLIAIPGRCTKGVKIIFPVSVVTS
jgi:hypothetical protein